MNYQQHLLIKLAEECNEVAQRALKAVQFGMDEIQAGQGLTNAERLDDELQDLFGTLRMLCEDHAFHFRPSDIRSEKKRAKIEKYRAYSEQLGLVRGAHDEPTF